MAHTEMPTTLEGAEAAIKKQEDFMTTMDANEEKINAVVETGRRLVSDGNINSDRIQEKVDSIDDRYSFLRLQRAFCVLRLWPLGDWPEVLETVGVNFPVCTWKNFVCPHRILVTSTWLSCLRMHREPNERN